MGLSSEHLEALVAAVLAVNQYPVEKAWGLIPKLREAGLTNPAAVVSEDIGDLTVKLFAAGYERGYLTEMMADRLQRLMRSVQEGVLNGLSEAVAKDDKPKAIALLVKVSGIGPVVAENAWMLMK